MVSLSICLFLYFTECRSDLSNYLLAESKMETSAVTSPLIIISSFHSKHVHGKVDLHSGALYITNCVCSCFMQQRHPLTDTHPPPALSFLPLVGNTSSGGAHERLDGLPWQLQGRDTVRLTDISDPARRRHVDVVMATR